MCEEEMENRKDGKGEMSKERKKEKTKENIDVCVRKERHRDIQRERVKRERKKT